MAAIKEMLESKGLRFHDRRLKWGAKLSSYKAELSALSEHDIPVFIELELDCAYPECSIIIDHHDDKAGHDAKTSIEQAAELLGLGLNRWQKLISANDRGHIRAMKLMDAAEEEIKEVRRFDRECQGISGEDEAQAHHAIAENLTEIAPDAVIIHCPLKLSSVVVDLLYSEYTHIFLRDTSGKQRLFYSGKGYVVKKMTAQHARFKKERPGIELDYWYGGGLPQYGYFSTNYQYTDDELQMMIREEHSRHIFMFAFDITKKTTDNSADEFDKYYIDLNELKGIFEQDWGEAKPFKKDEAPERYNEFVYFHEFARQALYNLEDKDQPPISYYFERDLGPDPYMTIHIKADKEHYYLSEGRKYCLVVDHISLHIFENGVGIMSIGLLNYDYPEVEDILLINDFGRRIYPQFLGYDDGVQATKRAFLADKIEFSLGRGDPIIEEFKTEKYNISENVIKKAEYIEKLLGDSFTKDYNCHIVIDDRMFTICWFCHSNFAYQLCGKNRKGEYEYLSSERWYRLLYIDGKYSGCKNLEMMKDYIENATYARWADDKTLYGLTRYSFITVVEDSWLPRNVIRKHVDTVYYQMIVLLLMQRASILKFSAIVSKISGHVRAHETGEGNNQNKMSLPAILKAVRNLDASVVHFVNRLWFTEVTPQEQGIEIYAMGQKNMSLESQLKDLKGEIKELYDFAELSYERKNAETVTVLTIIGAVFFPLALLTGFWGMNLGFLQGFFENRANSDIFRYGLPFFNLFTIAALAISGWFIVAFTICLLNKIYKQRDELLMGRVDFKILTKVVLQTVFKNANVLIPLIILILMILCNLIFISIHSFLIDFLKIF